MVFLGKLIKRYGQVIYGIYTTLGFTNPNDIGGLQLWLQGDDTTYLNSKLAADFTTANSEYFSSLSTDFRVTNENFSLGGWFWFDTTALGNDCALMGIFDNGGGNRRSYRLAKTTADAFQCIINDSGTGGAPNVSVGDATILSANTWYFAVFVYDADNDLLKISVNGNTFTTTAQSTGAFSTTFPFYVGRDGFGDYQDGRMDNLFFYHKALTQAQVVALYNSGNGVNYEDLTADQLTSLVAWWDLDETSGNRSDSQGGNTLTDNNTVGFALGKVADTPVIDISQIWRWTDRSDNGYLIDQDTATAQALWKSQTPNALFFDGTTDFYDVSAILSEIGSDTVGTVCTWLKPVDATPSNDQYFFSIGDTDANTYILFAMNTAGTCTVTFAISGTVQWSVVTDSAVFSDNTWTHVALVQNGTTPILYVDGVEVAQTLTSNNDGNWINSAAGLDNVIIGCASFNSLGNVLFYNGAEDQILYYSAALSGSQVRQIYNLTASDRS